MKKTMLERWFWMKNQVSLNGMLSMRKVISEKGKKTIEAFVKENLSGRVNESTVQAYIDMAKSNMDIHGGLPSLEISMCFSLTGDEESLDLEKDDVAYEDCVFDNADELCAVFGKEILDALKKAGFEKQTENFGEIWLVPTFPMTVMNSGFAQ